MITVPFSIVTNNKTDNRFVFEFETAEEAQNFFEEKGFKYDLDNPAIISKPFKDKNGVTSIAFAILPQAAEPEKLSKYEISSLEPEVLP